MRRLGFQLTVLGMLLCLACCGRTEASELTAEDRAADKRLESPVTLSENRICIGELLEKIARQTGVAVTSDEKDSGSGIEVAVHWKQVPLCDALNSLWALVSYRRALWAWYWEGKPAQRKYTLARTPAARQLASQLEQLLHDTFHYQVQAMVAAAKMSPEERSQLSVQDKEGLLKPLLDDKRTVGGLDIFTEATTPEQQAKIIAGGQLSIPFEQLSEKSKDYVRSEYKLSGLTAAPDPTRITFYTHADHYGIPCMYMSMGDIGAYGYLGGGPLQRAMHSKTGTLWYLPGDSYTNPLAKTKIARPPKEEVLPLPGHVIESRLEQLARLTPLNLTARLAPVNEQTEQDPGEPSGRTVAAYLNRLEEWNPRMQRKWRNNILLLTYPGWYLEGEPIAWAKQKAR